MWPAASLVAGMMEVHFFTQRTGFVGAFLGVLYWCYHALEVGVVVSVLVSGEKRLVGVLNYSIISCEYPTCAHRHRWSSPDECTPMASKSIAAEPVDPCPLGCDAQASCRNSTAYTGVGNSPRQADLQLSRSGYPTTVSARSCSPASPPP